MIHFPYLHHHHRHVHYRLESMVEVEATAYAPNCGDSGRTSTGTRPHLGTIATSPRFLGRKFTDTSGNVYVSEDTGGDIQGNRIDIWMPSCRDAMNFGRRVMRMRIR